MGAQSRGDETTAIMALFGVRLFRVGILITLRQGRVGRQPGSGIIIPRSPTFEVQSKLGVLPLLSNLENSQAMAALPLCASPPAAVAAASLISRPFHGAMNVRPLGRAPAPVKLQARARDSFRSHCEKRADGLHEPDPEPENHDPDKAATPQNVPLVEKLLNYRRALFAAMGLREPPDMFLKEKEQISDYMMKLSCSADSRNLNESVVARMVCSEARQALNLASKVMDIAHDDPGTVEFSQHTIDQMVRTYATILYNVADHAYHEKIGIETTLSFLGALRGLGAICHILVQDIVAKLKDGHLKNKFIHHMDTLSQKFYTEVNNLEDKVARMKEQKLQQMVIRILMDGRMRAYVYIFQLTDALDKLTSKE